MKTLSFILFCVLVCAAPAWAQEDNIAGAASTLQDVLGSLRDSVDKLSMDNDQLAARDNTIRQQIGQLEVQLKQLQTQGGLLDRSAQRLQGKDDRRSQAVARLEKTNYDLDNRTQKTDVAIRLTRASLDAGYKEDQKLLLQLKNLTPALSAAAASAPTAPSSDAQAAFEMQKLKLMKLISESQDRQQALHEAILKAQQNAPVQPAAEALVQQQILKSRIKDLQDEMASWPSEKTLVTNAAYLNDWNDDQLKALEGQLKVLQKNYVQLKDLMGRMEKKTVPPAMAVGDHMEEQKLQGHVDKLNQQATELKNELFELRAEMVDLDKRKTRLEAMLHHP